MNSQYKVSIIISIYKNITALKCILDSLKVQTEQDFEIIISEDARHEDVADFCDKYHFSHDHQHLTQPDNGWRKNVALNRAIKAAKSDYLIFIDGDCVLHPRFVEFHLKLSGKKRIIAGKRVKLNETLSSIMLKDISSYKKIEKQLTKMLIFGGKKDNAFIEDGIFIKPKSILSFMRKLRTMRNLKGCNMSFSKEAAYAINGFDEDYTRPAIGEDIDLVWRFKAAGYKIVSARNLAVQYHLHHKENWSDQSENVKLMEVKMNQNKFFCTNGLIKK